MKTSATTGLRHRDEHAVLNGITLHYVEAGSGPLVVLLHGFPEFWYSWRFQIPVLAAAGFRVVAPDLRGYNTSSKPAGRRAYRVEALAQDISDLIAHLGESRALVVGHDWGGVVAYELAARHPERVSRLAILNAPHLKQYRRTLLNPEQLSKSWYVFFFQLPWLPERLMSRNDFQWLRDFWSQSTRSDARTAADVEKYVAAFREPGALRSAINYYRSSSLGFFAKSAGPVTCPTLVLYGEDDVALTEAAVRPNPLEIQNARFLRIPDAGHFVHQDAPDVVNPLLADFLRGADVGSAV